MNIMEAVKDLKDEILAGTEIEKAVSFTAEAYGVKPEVLKIRFERAYGTPVDSYQAPKTVSQADVVEAAIAAEAKKWRLSEAGQARLGSKFFADGEWWHFVAYTGSRVHAVRADSGKVWIFSGAWVRTILGQVSKAAA